MKALHAFINFGQNKLSLGALRTFILHNPPKGDRREVVRLWEARDLGGLARSRKVLTFHYLRWFRVKFSSLFGVGFQHQKYAVVSCPNFSSQIWCWIPAPKFCAVVSCLNFSSQIWCWIPTPKILGGFSRKFKGFPA